MLGAFRKKAFPVLLRSSFPLSEALTWLRRPWRGGAHQDGEIPTYGMHIHYC